MKVYIPYYRQYSEQTCNCGKEEPCCEAVGEFDELMKHVSKPVFKVARKTREEAIVDLGKHIISEQSFEDFYFLLLDIRDKTSLRKLGEKLHLDNFLERCQGIDKNDREGLKKEFGPDLIQQIQDKIIPDQWFPFPIEQFQTKYHPNKHMYRGEKYLNYINQKHHSVRLEDIENYIDINAGDLFNLLTYEYSVFDEDLPEKFEDWEDKLNSVNSWEEFRDKFYHQVVQDYDSFDNWVPKYTYYDIQDYEII